MHCKMNNLRISLRVAQKYARRSANIDIIIAEKIMRSHYTAILTSPIFLFNVFVFPAVKIRRIQGLCFSL